MADIVVPLLDARRKIETDFVQAAFSGICQHTISPADVLAVCPLELLEQGTIPHAIYRAIVELDQKGSDVSPVSVWAHIYEAMQAYDKKIAPWPRNITSATIGEYSTSIYGSSESAIMFFAEQARDEGLKRVAEKELYALVLETQRIGASPADIASGMLALAQKLDGGAPAAYNLSPILDRVLAAAENGVAAKPLPTPWPNLNKVLKGGLVSGELAILAARPGMGKTALAGCMAVETARSGVPVLFISREVSDTMLGARMLARESRVDARYFRQGIGDAPDIIPAMHRGHEKLHNLPVRIVEKTTVPMTPREVRRLAKTTQGVGLIIVDYLQLLNPDTKQNSREREVAEMSRSMKQLALDCKCPVLLLSQLNRQVEETAREPRLSDLRESGAIEQDADIVIFLHAKKDAVNLSNTPIKAIVAKGRSSGTGTANLIFSKPFADFAEDTSPEMTWNRNSGGSSADEI